MKTLTPVPPDLETWIRTSDDTVVKAVWEVTKLLPNPYEIWIHAWQGAGCPEVSDKNVIYLTLDAFTKAYIECALWSSQDCDDVALSEGHGFSDIALDTNRQAIKDCAAFQTDNAELLALAGDDSQNGHDFWLSRNGHGAGFFDRGYVDNVGRKLQEAARIYGTVDLYVGDDGKIYS